ncbi:hypothetical protein B0H14DRAFT_3429584 [Mycena olivaceomarginata]|nr:hypothetical protein B0H14DRAFT_3429584 [Mycena olivaceomarginata]
MAPKPKIGVSVDFATMDRRTTRSQATGGSPPPPEATENGTEGRLPRASKTVAQKNAPWVGAAPKGPKPKDVQGLKLFSPCSQEDLSDKDDAESEKSETSSNHVEDDDFAVEEDEDLQNVPAEVLSRTFAQERPHWQPLQDDSEAEDADDRADHAQPPSRPSSRASMSSGYLSLPASELDSGEESDAEANAAFTAFSAAAQRVPPVPEKKWPKRDHDQ